MSFLRRKISNTRGKSGEGSYTLTLPKNWCEENNLLHGEELELRINSVLDPSILILIPKTEVDQKKVVELNYNDYSISSDLSRAILGRYLDGYEKIHIINVPSSGEQRMSTRREIRAITRKLTGCNENEKETSFELNIISDLNSPISLLTQLFRKSKFMFLDVFTAYLTYDTNLAREIVKMDDEADKIYFNIVRTLKLLLSKPYLKTDEGFEIVETLEYRMVASNLENLADSTEVVAKLILDGKKRWEEDNITEEDISKITKEEKQLIKNLSTKLMSVLEKAFDCFIKNDEKRAIDLGKQRQDLRDEITKGRKSSINNSVIEIFDSSIDCIIDIIELVGE